MNAWQSSWSVSSRGSTTSARPPAEVPAKETSPNPSRHIDPKRVLCRLPPVRHRAPRVWSAADSELRRWRGHLLSRRLGFRNALLRSDLSRNRWLLGALGALAYFALLNTFFTARPGIIVQGTVIGGLTALIAFGIALIYRANRIVSFAQGDLGAAPAALTVLLIVGPGWPFPVALAVGLVVAALLGALVERVIVRRFAKAPRLILTVATIGLSQVLAGLGLVLPRFFNFTTPPQDYPSPLNLHFTIDPITFEGADVLAILAVPAAIIALTWLLRSTDVGMAIRASAESADRAAMLGVPVDRVRMLVWVIAAVLATIAMVLRAGIIGLPIGSVLGPAILVRALAAAVIGRMENLRTIFVASVAIGILESAVVFERNSSLLVAPIVFVAVLGALAFQHRDRLTRFVEASSWRTITEVRPIPSELAGLPEVRWGSRALRWGFVALLLALPVVLKEGDTARAATTIIFGIVAVSLVVLTGWSGQVSLGQVAFMGVGAAVAGWLTSVAGVDLSLAMLLAGGAGAAVATVVGIPALRVRGLLLAVVTLSLALAMSTFGLNRTYVGWLPEGRIARNPLFGRIVIESETRYYYLCVAVLLVVLVMVSALRKSRTGRVLIATRENERSAQSYGVSATRAKLTAFALSGFLAAVAGALFVHQQQSLGVSAYAPEQSLQAFTTVVIGGLASLPGALLGTVYVEATTWFQPWLPRDIRPLLSFLGTGVGLLVVLMVLPGGLGSLLYRVRDSLLRAVAARRGIVVPSLNRDAAPVSTDDHDAPTVRAERTPPMPAIDDALLSVRGLEGGYDGVQILFGIDLDVRPGEVVALLGTNGAGKSTLLRAVSGLLHADHGTVTFDGDTISGRTPQQIVRSGLVQVPGGQGVFPSLSVGEHLKIAGWLRRRDRSGLENAIESALSTFPELQGRLALPAGSLSGGEQQMLTLSMALISEPKLLLIDELSLGLAPVIVERLVRVVRQISATGVAIVVVEQSVNVALTLAERAYFMEKGEVRFSGPTQDLLAQPEILRSVFLEGVSSQKRQKRPAAPARPDRPSPTTNGAEGGAEPALEARGLTVSFGGVRAVSDVDLLVGPGEIVGIIGPNGAG
ncbi:MAG: ATP-binding cassette domain-containing protein, partial [Actinomycetota bacterium]|nr:ATP-binding cassette domain-containing protein [Actinomycetota bacterium]